MKAPIQNTIGKIFIQYIIALILFVGLVSVAKAGMNNTTSQVASHSVSQTFSDKRIAGMIRSTIAFESRLSGREIEIQVSNAKVTVSGILGTKHEHDILLGIISHIVGSETMISIERLLLVSEQTNVSI
jgi:hypothetical protein